MKTTSETSFISFLEDDREKICEKCLFTTVGVFLSFCCPLHQASLSFNHEKMFSPNKTEAKPSWGSLRGDWCDWRYLISNARGASAPGPVLWSGIYLLTGDVLGQGRRDTFLLLKPALLG